MSYERYKDYRLAPDDNGCWDILDASYQQQGTYPSKAAAKRAIDEMDSTNQPEPSLRDPDYDAIQRIYLDWHDGKRPLSGFIKALQEDKAQAVAEAYKDAVTQIMAAKTEGLFDGPDLFVKRAPIEQACINLVGYETYKAIQESLPEVDLTKGTEESK